MVGNGVTVCLLLRKRRQSKVYMNNNVAKTLFGFAKVKWLQYRGEVNKYISYRR